MQLKTENENACYLKKKKKTILRNIFLEQFSKTCFVKTGAKQHNRPTIFNCSSHLYCKSNFFFFLSTKIIIYAVILELNSD